MAAKASQGVTTVATGNCGVSLAPLVLDTAPPPPLDLIGDAADFLSDGMVCQVMLYEGTPLSVEMPPTVTMAVVEADPVVRGQTASSSYKPGRQIGRAHV